MKNMRRELWALWLEEIPQILQIMTSMVFLAVIFRQPLLLAFITLVLLFTYMQLIHGRRYSELLKKDKDYYLDPKNRDVLLKLPGQSTLAFFTPLLILVPVVFLFSNEVIKQINLQ